MGESIKVSLMAILVILMTLPLKQEKAHLGLLVSLAMGLFIFGLVMKRIYLVMDAFELLKSYLGAGGGYLGILLKVLGITYVCEFAASICRDAGYGFVAGQLEVLGKLSVMVSGISLLFALIEQIGSLA